MTSKQPNIRRALVLGLICGALTGLTASLAGQDQTCVNNEDYHSACKVKRLYKKCHKDGNHECAIKVSAASVDQNAVCVDTKSHAKIHWNDATGNNARIELTFDYPPDGTDQVVFSHAGTVTVTFAKSASGCFHYYIKSCPPKGDCVKQDPKVIVNGSSNPLDSQGHHGGR